MAWMDAPPCGRQVCNGTNAGDAIISDIAVSHEFWQDYGNPEEETIIGKGGQGADDQHARPWEPQDSPMHWVPDPWAAWQCHHYSREQQETKWCASVGISEGYQYEYNGGVDSPCGPCWCCKRKAKLAAVPVSTTITTTTLASQLVWVVDDPKDAMFARIVPEGVISNPLHFVRLQDRGIARWEHQGRPVKLMSRSAISSMLREEDVGDCRHNSRHPCDASLKRNGAYFDMVLQKFLQKPLRGLAKTQWPTSQATMIGLMLMSIAVALLLIKIRAGCWLSNRRGPSSLETASHLALSQAQMSAGWLPLWSFSDGDDAYAMRNSSAPGQASIRQLLAQEAVA